MDFKEGIIKKYFKDFPRILNDSNILKRSEFCKKEVKRLSIEFANTLKVLLRETIPKILNQNIKYEIWYEILGFHWDNEVRRVTNGDSYAVSPEKLKQIKSVVSDILSGKIIIPKKDCEFDIVCYNCGETSQYQITDIENLPKRPRKKCPYCDKMITLRISQNNGKISVRPYLDYNADTSNENLENDFNTEDSNEIINFIKEYIIFSFYVTGLFGHRVKFSAIVLKNSNCLEPRSWLIENLRYLFPKMFGLPISNRVLNYFIFRDMPSPSDSNRLTCEFLQDQRVSYKPNLNMLFAINYNIFRLSLTDLDQFGISISKEELIQIKKFSSFIIYYFIFNNPFDIPYISDTTSGGIPVSFDFFVPEYFIIREIYFIMCFVSDDFLSFTDIREILGIKVRFQRYLSEGTRMSNILTELISQIDKYIKNQKILNYFNKKLNLFYEVSKIRERYYASTLEFASSFQKKVHNFFNIFFKVEFDSEKNIVSLIKKKYIHIDYKRIPIHHNLAFDGYFPLDDPIRKKYNINKKWKAIVFEAHGNWHIDLNTYLRMFPYKSETDFIHRQEIDKLKRDICSKYNFILIEIYESIEENEWRKLTINQIEKKITNIS